MKRTYICAIIVFLCENIEYCNMTRQDRLEYEESFARNLKNARKKRGLTQVDLATQSQLNINTIKRIELMKCDTSVYNAASICRALGVSLDIMIFSRID